MKIQATKDIRSTPYQQILNLRKEVFIKEQHVPTSLELRDEQGPIYYGGLINNNLVCCARVKEKHDKTWHTQRVATKVTFRGQGLNSQLVKRIKNDVQAKGISTLILGAQDQAQGFYLELGSKVVRDAFIDVGISYHMMQKEI